MEALGVFHGPSQSIQCSCPQGFTFQVTTASSIFIPSCYCLAPSGAGPLLLAPHCSLSAAGGEELHSRLGGDGQAVDLGEHWLWTGSQRGQDQTQRVIRAGSASSSFQTLNGSARPLLSSMLWSFAQYHSPGEGIFFYPRSILSMTF